VNSTLHQDVCRISIVCATTVSKTCRFGALGRVLDLEPARTHNFPLDREELEGSSVGAEDMAEGSTAGAMWQFRL
jgi:hypothetical protein